MSKKKCNMNKYKGTNLLNKCVTVVKGTIANEPFLVNGNAFAIAFTYLFYAALSDLLLSNYIYKIN